MINNPQGFFKLTIQIIIMIKSISLNNSFNYNVIKLFSKYFFKNNRMLCLDSKTIPTYANSKNLIIHQ